MKYLYFALCITLLYVIGLFAVRQGFTNVESTTVENTSSAWKEGEEWIVLKEILVKEAPDIQKASMVSSTSPRLIASIAVVEQLRVFNDNRELFKTIFAPTKKMAMQNQFSMGILGIKLKTALEIERNEGITITDQERLDRLTEGNYYSYLYAGYFMKQIKTQWQKAGFDISQKPDILATLYNIGFEHSIPKSDPQVGGALIEINGQTYSFGGLAYQFFISDELTTEFPY
ncbi:hypothetical protein KAZ66_02690 [Candidatus Woesebacteria bacterium]|jgi:hypothetical protein|nr:hypothetical protein [Candidatus Woesebacteria bacterium]